MSASVAATRPRGPRRRAPISVSISANSDGTTNPSINKAQHHRFDDEDDVPRIPLLGKRPEGANPVVVGEIEQDVAETGQAGVEEQPAPARRQVGVVEFAASKTPYEVHESDYRQGVERHSDEGMGESAMVGEAEGRAAKSADHVEVGRFGRQRQSERGQRRLAVQSGASQAGAGQEVSKRFQAVRGILLRRADLRHQRPTGRPSEVNLTRDSSARRKVIRLDELPVPGSTRWSQQGQSIRHNRDFGRQRAEQFAVSFHVNVWLPLRGRGCSVLAGDFRAV